MLNVLATLTSWKCWRIRMMRHRLRNDNLAYPIPIDVELGVKSAQWERVGNCVRHRGAGVLANAAIADVLKLS